MRMPSEIPFFVLNLGHGKAKALFTVPSHLAKSLTLHPVLCRGAAFDLQVDDEMGNEEDRDNILTCFLSTEFESPNPEDTANAISVRLASRVEDSCDNPLAEILGL